MNKTSIALLMLLMYTRIAEPANAWGGPQSTPTVLDIRTLGARGDGVADDGPAVQAAIEGFADNKGGTVFIPPGDYKMSGFIVDQLDVTIALSPGARIFLTRTIKLHRAGARFVGGRSSDHAWTPAVDDPSPGNIIWQGESNSVMFQVGGNRTAGNNGANRTIQLSGVTLDGGGIPGMTGLMVGYDTEEPPPHDSNYHLIDNIRITGVKYGIRIGYGVDGTRYRGILISGDMRQPIATGSIGIQAINSVHDTFLGGVICHFDTLMLLGDGSGRVGPDYFSVSAMDLYDFGTVAIDAQTSGGGGIVIRDNYFEGQGTVGNKRALRVGRLGGYVASLLFEDNVFGDASATGIVEGIGWRGLTIHGNTFNRGPTPAVIFRNSGGGSVRRGGSWYGNHVTEGSDGTNLMTEIVDVTGFEFLQLQNPMADAAHNLHNIPTIETARVSARLGPQLAREDVTLGPGWGANSVTSIAANDSRGRLTITSSGAGQRANATVTITFKYAAPWASAPFAMVARNGGDQPGVTTTWTTTATTLVITFQGTPVAGQEYTFEYMLMG